MCDFTRSDAESIREHARATEGPSYVDRPFGCPPDTVIDIPIPPSVNETRRINKAALGKLAAWKKAADATVMASGQVRGGWRNISRYELVIVLDEARCRLDPDNPIKSAIDYLRRLHVITNDAPKNARQILIRWGEAPEGMRLIVRPIEAPYDGQRDMTGSLQVAFDAVKARVAAGGPPWTPREAKG